MKVKIFDCEDIKDLEEKINKFLDNTKDIEVIDIKYSTMKGTYIYNYSALIMYQHKIIMSISEIEADGIVEILNRK